ncbi:MAG: serine acetyltransferase [Clostridia bacterium]|nr:serine acetyltransferase [Clostridia bacterium]
MSAPASLKRLLGRLLFPDFTAIHWRCYRKGVASRGLGGALARVRARRIQARYNASIPFKSGITPFVTPHELSGIFISKGAVIGEGCTIFQQVTIGSNTLEGSRRYGAPTIGRNVYIGAGAKIIGRVTIGDNARIGAGCVVTEDIPAGATVVLPKPRVILRDDLPDNTFHPYPD